MSHAPLPSVVSRPDDHVQDLCQLLERITVTGSSLDTITWKRKTVEETITLSQASHTNSSCFNQNISVPNIPNSMHAQGPLLPLSSSSDAQSSTQGILHPILAAQVPKPSEIAPPRASLEPEGFYVITVGQEVGIFYHWADVAARTHFVSGNIHKGYPSFQKALEAYTVHYNEGRVRAVPIPGGPFWPSASPPSPSWSVDSDDLWLQVDDLSETISHCRFEV